MTSNVLDDIFGLVDTELLGFTEEARQGINKGRLIQGDPTFEKDQQLNKTPRYLGGIGLTTEGLSEEIIKKAGAIVSLDSGDYAVFTELEVVILASARVRRFFGEVDGKKKLFCGTNQDGAGAKGWSGVACAKCPNFPKNFEGDKQDACGASVPVLVYIPSLDHTAILDFKGASYMDATGWLSQNSLLCSTFAKLPEMQAKQPGLTRVNSFFFRTNLSAGEFKEGNNNNKFQSLRYTKVSAPYEWTSLLNKGKVIAKCKEILKNMAEHWETLYVQHNSTAVLALPSAEAVAGHPTTAEAPKALIGEKVTIVEPEPQPAKQPEVKAAASAASVQTQTVAVSETPPPVSEVPLEDEDDMVAGF